MNSSPTDFLSTILARLDDCKEVKPNQWKARCPAHEDDRPSLSITLSENDKPLLHCFAGCTFREIIAALEIKPPVKYVGKRGRKRQPLGRIVCTYDYTNETGQLLYQKVRFDPKDFRVRHQTPDGRWMWGIGNQKAVLYRLPDLVKVSDAAIYVVEGEKDADRLASLGIIATCNFDGASKDDQKSKWRPDEYNPYLRGRVVYILPDNDSTGQAHANYIASTLQGVAQVVKVITLPGLSAKQDVSDWLDLGNTVTELQTLSEAAPPWKPPPVSPTPPATAELNLKYPKTADYLRGFQMCGFAFRLNELGDTIEVNQEPMSKGKESFVFNRMRDIGLSSVSWVQRAWEASAYENRYHPIKDYFNSLSWDGQDHIARFVGHLQETTGMAFIAFRRWLIGAVAKVFQQGQNFMLVWDGPQNVGKSTLARWLCPLPTYFIEGRINTEDKDNNLRACSHLVWEVSELQATTRKNDREALKSFITQQVFTVRRAYGEYDLVKPAMSSLIGTINEDGAGFLTDPTSNRRFVILYLKKIDFAYRTTMKPEWLWAQAVALYRAGEPWELSPEEARRRDEINLQYQMSSVVSLLFFDYFTIDLTSPKFTTASDVLQTLELAGLKGSQQMNLNELARLMKQHGVECFRAKVGEKRPTAYRGVLRLNDVSEAEIVL